MLDSARANLVRDMVLSPDEWPGPILHMKKFGADGGMTFGFIRVCDIENGIRVTGKDGAPNEHFASVEELIAAGWAVD